MVSNIEKPANRRQSLLKRFKALLFAPWFLRMMFWIVRILSSIINSFQ